MPRILSSEAVPLVIKAQFALGLSQRTLGEMLGISRRTVIRWGTGSVPSVSQVIAIAKAVYPIDPALASDLAVAAGTRLAELGLGIPVVTEPRVPVKELAVDSIVCAAASAGATTPQSAKAAVLAALKRAALLGVTLEELMAALAGDGK
jgi:hypothetical protein